MSQILFAVVCSIIFVHSLAFSLLFSSDLVAFLLIELPNLVAPSYLLFAFLLHDLVLRVLFIFLGRCLPHRDVRHGGSLISDPH